MRYFLNAIEAVTGFSFQQEVASQEEAEALQASLHTDGYESFQIDERWSSLDEMHQTLAAEEQSS
jgi:hypothetical protein